MEIKCDRYGWRFKEAGSLDTLGEVVLGSDDAEYEEFVLALSDLKSRYKDWEVDFPIHWRGVRKKDPEGASYMRVTRPGGKVTVMEFTRRPLSWRFVRSIEVRYGKEKGRKGQRRKGTLAESLQV